MMQQLYFLSPLELDFPDPETALQDPDGLLAVGGCLSLMRLKNAYNNGIFPWYNEQEPIMWWSPSQRGIIELDEFHVSRSLKRTARRLTPKVTINHAFVDVMRACREQRLHREGTWISRAMLKAYHDAHLAGFAHSLEVWHQGALAGGLYGIMQNGVFCGESMFHHVTDGSKLAVWALVNWLKQHQVHFIDCQLENPYLTALGAKSISRAQFLTRLKEAKDFQIPEGMWQAQELVNIYD
ncbi:leucyl/phenylalanyl-tRNA--protein transferase [Pseudoalteromonas fenneropenaei]|uniref:Leucyl/phenylalanyl-tRNA--protein transferase n=1 Tax=Pseudoalteromonas fenneropenaei TaxID=1737459 RepID=A0ABV7CHS0_9GAMM